MGGVGFRWFAAAALLGASALSAPAAAQPAPAARLELQFMPTGNAQLAIWIERGGEFVATVRLTESVAYRGLGNRPGASEMNSGFRWPYGRREGALPVWAARRASQAGARQFRRVIFQNRASEGHASRTVEDSSVDHHYCLQWDPKASQRDALDAVSCASVFNSDKGRFITEADVANGYSEPYATGKSTESRARPLSLESLYPPRRDLTPCSNCLDHADVADFRSDALTVMPELDAVTMATPDADALQKILYPLPADLAPDDYRVCLEINVEGDYNWAFNDTTYPTPRNTTAVEQWDGYALKWGYAYRGQPSVVYCADLHIGGDQIQTATTDDPLGTAGVWELDDPEFGSVRPMGDMTTDPIRAPGSGGDRLQLIEEGHRLAVTFNPGTDCRSDTAPSAVGDLTLDRHPKELHAHEWARVHFRAASDDLAIFRYDVRVSTAPVTDEASFMAGTAAKQATVAAAGLSVPTTAAAGEPVSFDIGGLSAQTHYFVAVRAIDGCAATGPISVAELTTPARKFATVSPCFIATAAWGSPLASEIGALRRFRDRELSTNALGRTLVRLYMTVGPVLADAIRPHDGMRAAARALLTPLVAFARMLDDAP